MAEVWFVRHGESTSNAGEVTSDTSRVELTARGRAQAKALSLVFPKSPDLVVVTPYLRTPQTAAPTLKRFPQARCETWPLQEFSCLSHADYANRTAEQRAPFVRAYWNRNDPDYIDGPGAESFSMMTTRINDAFRRLQKSPEDFIVVFTHGRIMQTARFLLARPSLPPKGMMAAVFNYTAQNEIENCAVLRMTADARGVSLHENDRRIFKAGFGPQKPKACPRGSTN